MRAAVYYQYGPPEVIRIEEFPKPVPKDGEVLIRVFATTVNRTDCAILRARPFIMRFFTGLTKPRNPVLGTDFAGMVEAIGDHVKDFKVGDKVFGFGDQGIKSQAEFMICNRKHAIAHMPSNCSFQQAAAASEGTHYAINFINKVKLEKGQKVLVHGATGAIGSALVQLLIYYGTEVTATGNTKNVDLIKSLGAYQVIDYEKQDFTKLNQTFDYVFDAVGKSTFGKCKALLKSNGVYISSELGPRSENLFFSLFGLVSKGKKVKFPFPSDINASLILIKKLIEEGKFTPLIDREYSLEEISKAYSYVESGQKTGNVVINIK
jgi:NADPH:quinone reductase-like Zn-dependent oxidoreductase